MKKKEERKKTTDAQSPGETSEAQEHTSVACEDCGAVRAERDELKTKYLRALADYQNFERRSREELGRVRAAAVRDIMTDLLPFLDNLEKAESFMSDPGLSMIKKQYEETLAELGLEVIDAAGKPFDPHIAEAVEIVSDTDQEDDTVVEIIRNGYRFKDAVIRVAQVKVAKK